MNDVVKYLIFEFVSLCKLYFSSIVKKALSFIIETVSNLFLEPTSTEQSV